MEQPPLFVLHPKIDLSHYFSDELMTSVYIDTIIQVFESEGNLHLVGGLSTGEVDIKGNDVKERVLHLIIPMSKASRILPDIAKSLPKLSPEENPDNALSDDTIDSKPAREIEGSGLHFKI